MKESAHQRVCLLTRARATNVPAAARGDGRGQDRLGKTLFSNSMTALEARNRIKDELSSYCVVTEAPKTTLRRRFNSSNNLHGQAVRQAGRPLHRHPAQRRSSASNTSSSRPSTATSTERSITSRPTAAVSARTCGGRGRSSSAPPCAPADAPHCVHGLPKANPNVVEPWKMDKRAREPPVRAAARKLDERADGRSVDFRGIRTWTGTQDATVCSLCK